jgi:NAD(P)-dependent dehydrogenase (short-subunit alcohol dehydrogenase family)
LIGKRVLVTGAGSGLGREVALQAVAEGAAAVCAADINPRSARATATESDRIVALEVDVANRESVDDMVSQAWQEMGGIDCLISAAGIFLGGAVLDVAEADWRRLMEVNAGGTFRCGQAVARRMVAAGSRGAIVNFGSFATRRVTPHGSAYAITKGLVTTLTYSMAVALAPSGIRVNAVAPGPIQTGLGGTRYEDPAVRARMQVGILAGRLGVPGDVAPAVIYLVSDAAACVTGCVLGIDGGLSASR